MVKMLPLSLSLLLGWTKGEGKCSSVTTSLTQTESASVFHFVYTDLVPSSVVKTQSRRQSGLVCSLLVVSLLLSAAVGGEGELVASLQGSPWDLLYSHAGCSLGLCNEQTSVYTIAFKRLVNQVREAVIL